MPKAKPSGAQNRKRVKELQNEAEKSSQLMQNYLKKRNENDDETQHVIEGEEEYTSPPEHYILEAENILQQNEEVNTDCEMIASNINSSLPMSSENIPNTLLFYDFGYLEFQENFHSFSPIISQKLRTEIILRGSSLFQNNKGSFAIHNGRSITTSWFKKKLANGGFVSRSWLIYSPYKEALFCFCCLLFWNDNCKTAFTSPAGFKDFKHSERVVDHENSITHRLIFTVWKETERRLMQGVGIDKEIEAQMISEKERWREILKRLLSCIKFLAFQNLALRGHNENLLNNEGNVGNFLGLLKLIALYDPLLASHLDYSREHPGSTSYLSPGIQNEFIHIMATTVRNVMVENIKKNKYYGLIFDSTPDLQHREQFSQVIRHVEIDFEKNTVEIKESFLGFTELTGKDAETLENTILKLLKNDGLQLSDCRSQCYDNAAVMTGHISGLQQRILKLNPQATFVNCDNHSLNLAGLHSAQIDPVMLSFFGVIEQIYLFFSRSTSRWQKMTDVIPLIVKRESATRWSARAEAVKAIFVAIDKFVEIFEDLSEDNSQTSDTRSDANSLIQNVLNFNFLVLIHFWHYILERIDRVQKRLQDPKMNFNDASHDLQGLCRHIKDIREDLCKQSLEAGKKKCSEWGVEIKKRVRRVKMRYGEKTHDSGLTAEEELERVLKCSIDRFLQEVETRFSRLNSLNEKFGYFLDIENLLNCTDSIKLKENCLNLAQFYNSDINGNELCNEINDCRMLLIERKEEIPKSPIDLLKFVISYGEDVFPNLRISLQILLTIGVSVSTCERSFSKLKLILSYLRASMGEARLNDLALLSIEKTTVEKINFDDVIDKFAAVKARKICL